MKTEIYPLDKMVFDGKEIKLGMNKQQVIELLGEPEDIRENYGGESWRHYYFDTELGLDYDENGELEFIEFLAGHDGSLRPYIYGVSAFDTKRDELVSILTEHNNGETDDSEDDSYAFLEIQVGIWQTADDDEFWTTIGIGKKGYYSSDEG